MMYGVQYFNLRTDTINFLLKILSYTFNIDYFKCKLFAIFIYRIYITILALIQWALLWYIW